MPSPIAAEPRKAARPKPFPSRPAEEWESHAAEIRQGICARRTTDLITELQEVRFIDLVDRDIHHDLRPVLVERLIRLPIRRIFSAVSRMVMLFVASSVRTIVWLRPGCAGMAVWTTFATSFGLAFER